MASVGGPDPVLVPPGQAGFVKRGPGEMPEEISPGPFVLGKKKAPAPRLKAGCGGICAVISS